MCTKVLSAVNGACRSDAGGVWHHDHKRAHHDHCRSHRHPPRCLRLQIHLRRLEPTACQHWACLAQWWCQCRHRYVQPQDVSPCAGLPAFPFPAFGPLPTFQGLLVCLSAWHTIPMPWHEHTATVSRRSVVLLRYRHKLWTAVRYTQPVIAAHRIFQCWLLVLAGAKPYS